MVHAKNYQTVSTLVKVMHKNRGLFFPDTVYISLKSTFSAQQFPL